MKVAPEVLNKSDNAPQATGLQSSSSFLNPRALQRIVEKVASSEEWIDRVRFSARRRWYERIYVGSDYDIWVISWLPGQATGFHDHGISVGAFTVATGILEEHRPGQEPVLVSAGSSRTFGSDYAHDVRNGSLGPAVSIHAYSPPLEEMNEFELEGEDLVPRRIGVELHENPVQRTQLQAHESIAGRSSIEQVLEAARARLRRLSPNEVYTAAEEKALLVDIRPESQRATEGEIPGACIIERNVLEWRLDPTSAWRLPIATDYDLPVIVFCSEGYTSSLAAAALQDLGLWRATDMVGGFQAWQEAGLPTLPSAATRKTE